jgi:hypothetical protein
MITKFDETPNHILFQSNMKGSTHVISQITFK